MDKLTDTHTIEIVALLFAFAIGTMRIVIKYVIEND